MIRHCRSALLLLVAQPFYPPRPGARDLVLLQPTARRPSDLKLDDERRHQDADALNQVPQHVDGGGAHVDVLRGRAIAAVAVAVAVAVTVAAQTMTVTVASAQAAAVQQQSHTVARSHRRPSDHGGRSSFWGGGGSQPMPTCQVCVIPPENSDLIKRYLTLPLGAVSATMSWVRNEYAQR